MVLIEQSTTRPQQLLGEYLSYADAERAVDALADSGFAVEHAKIVGTGLRSVEDVTGRLTNRGAAAAGLASGAWFGLLLGAMFGLFSTGSAVWGLLTTGAALGAVWGASFGYLAHRSLRGRRDFTSSRRIEAEQYGVYVTADLADEARRRLLTARHADGAHSAS